MHTLAVGPQWPTQIAAIREAQTDTTDIVRSGLDCYRICRASSAEFKIAVAPSQPPGALPLLLTLRESDFYVLQMGSTTMERYSSMIKTDEKSRGKFQVSEGRLNTAILDLARDRSPTRQFENQTLLTFCVAESLRSEALAQQIGSTLAAGGSLDIQRWVQHIRDWGTTSAHLRLRQMPPSDLRSYAAGLKVLCRAKR